MPRPAVKTFRMQLTVSEPQLRQIERLSAVLGFATNGEALRYLVTRALQIENASSGLGANSDMAESFREFVSLVARGAAQEEGQ